MEHERLQFSHLHSRLESVKSLLQALYDFVFVLRDTPAQQWAGQMAASLPNKIQPIHHEVRYGRGQQEEAQ
jgi:hypothetical protein